MVNGTDGGPVIRFSKHVWFILSVAAVCWLLSGITIANRAEDFFSLIPVSFFLLATTFGFSYLAWKYHQRLAKHGGLTEDRVERPDQNPGKT